MIDYLILFILLSEIIILVIIDKINYGTLITPFTLLSVPYAIIVVTAYFFAPAFGFIHLYTESLLIWVAGLFLFWLGGLIIALPFSTNIRSATKSKLPFMFEKEPAKIVLILSWMTISVSAYKFFSTIKSLGWQQLGSDDFAKTFGTGWDAHFMVFGTAMLIFLIGTTSRRDLFNILTILIFLVLNFMYPVKSGIIIPILAGFIYRYLTGRFKLTFTKSLTMIVMIFLIFNLFYLIEFGARNISTVHNKATYEYLSRHFLHYLFAGVLSFGNFVQNGFTNVYQYPQVIFAPFVNLYSVISGGEIISNWPAPAYFSVIDAVTGNTSNVNTFFGTILIRLGSFSGIIYVLFTGTFIYGLFTIGSITRNCWIILASVYIGTMLFLGWFDFYFALLKSVEVPFYLISFGVISVMLKSFAVSRFSNKVNKLYSGS